MFSVVIFFIFLCSEITVCQVAAFYKRKQIAGHEYIENLEVHRILFGDECQKKKEKKVDTALSHTYDVTDQLDELLIKRKDAYKKRGQICGYTIQAYKGSSRAMALQLQQKILTRNPNYKPKIRFVQPFYEVLVGFFFEQIEAHKVYFTIKKYILRAMMRPFLFSQEAYQQYREKDCSIR